MHILEKRQTQREDLKVQISKLAEYKEKSIFFKCLPFVVVGSSFADLRRQIVRGAYAGLGQLQCAEHIAQ